jgi:hypothetical protein
LWQPLPVRIARRREVHPVGAQHVGELPRQPNPSDLKMVMSVA